MSELLFNKSGMLIMTQTERNHYFTEAVAEFTKLGITASRKSQHTVYADLMKQLLKIDIESDPDSDPFKEVTGFPLKTFLLDKYKGGKEGINIALAHTDFISAAEILTLGTPKNPKRRKSKKEKKFEQKKGSSVVKIYTDNELADTWGEKIKTEKVSTIVYFRLIGPILINQEKDWQLNFSFCDLSTCTNTKVKERMHIFKGIIVLEPEPLEKIKTSVHFGEIYKMLVDVANWFNHDMIGHGTLDFFSEGPEGTHCHGMKCDTFLPFEQPYWNIRTLITSSPTRFSRSIWLEERRRESLQFELIEACFRRRPALEKYLTQHVRKFKKLLLKAAFESNPGPDVVNYFLGVYIYCLARIIRFNELFQLCKKEQIVHILGRITGYNPKEESTLRGIHDNYLGVPYVERTVYNSKDGMKIPDLKFVPHKVFFEQIHSRLFT